jgi:hypothetical protein
MRTSRHPRPSRGEGRGEGWAIALRFHPDTVLSQCGMPEWNQRPCSRRTWLHGLGAAAFPLLGWRTLAATPREARAYHLCLSPAVVASDPELLEMVRNAGVNTVWLAGFFYGHRPYPDELIRQARRKVDQAGLEAQLITVPLGHPGDSLGATDGGFPLTPPNHWRTALRPDGKLFAGTSLHSPATEENAAALRALREMGFSSCFADDDFRLARGPGEIGGCYCTAHRGRFLERAGYGAEHWDELLDDVRARRLTPRLRAWIECTCDELSASFRAQARAFRGELGIMVMYLGAEKAGIRLRDYRRGPFKHFWGEAERLVGEDRPFSLWLALGIPFEVVDRPSTEGWTFLSDFDLRELAGVRPPRRSRWVARQAPAPNTTPVEVVPETLTDLFAFKRRIADRLGEVPHLAEEEPAVCAWYPSAGKVVVWNLSEQARTLTLVQGRQRRTERVEPLGVWIAETI